MPSPKRNNFPNSPTYRAAKASWNKKGKSKVKNNGNGNRNSGSNGSSNSGSSSNLAVRGPRNLAQIESLMAVLSTGSNRGGTFALPYYGHNAPPRSGNSPVLLSPVVSVNASSVPSGSTNTRNWEKEVSNESRIPSRKSRVKFYAELWLQIPPNKLQPFIAPKGWLQWMKFFHPNKYPNNSPNRAARRRALLLEAQKGYEKNKKLVRRLRY